MIRAQTRERVKFFHSTMIQLAPHAVVFKYESPKSEGERAMEIMTTHPTRLFLDKEKFFWSPANCQRCVQMKQFSRIS